MPSRGGGSGGVVVASGGESKTGRGRGRGRGRGGRSSSSSSKNGGRSGRPPRGGNDQNVSTPPPSSDPYAPGPSAFSSNFPSPQRPRRHPPSVHRDSYRGHAAENNANGVVFRNADSTQRALSELAKRRHERMERRRAGGLLAGLLLLAVCVHLMNAGEEVGTGGGGGGAAGGVRSSSASRYGGDGAIDYGGAAAEGVSAVAASDVDGAGRGGGGTDGVPDAGARAGAAERDREEFEARAAGEDAKAKKKRIEDEREAALPEAVEADIEDGKEFLRPIRHFAELSSPRRKSDVPFFFHVPRSGGQTMKDIAGKCLKLTLASEVGVRDGHGRDPELKVVNIKDGNYVNVDTTSLDGISRAASMGLAPSGLAHLVSSNYFSDAGSLFDLRHQGRAFTILRNPVERAVSMYYYRRAEDTLDSSITLEEYAQGNGIENNWMTRYLVNAMEGELTKEHLNNAKEVLERKFLIGFLDDGEETMHRLMKYFGWEYDEDETKQMNQEDCIKDLLRDGTNVNVEGYEMPKKGTQAYALLTWQTQFDMKLYDHAKELFDAQTKHWGTKERKKLLKKKKKKANGK